MFGNRRLAGIAAAAPLAAGALWLAVTVAGPIGPAPPEGFEALRAAAPQVTSRRCESCHVERTASWRRTFHRTMTQRAEGAAVVAPFDGRERVFLGVAATPRQSVDGGFEIVTTHPVTGGIEAFPLVYAVGSRRMQQYVTRIGDRHVRLPVAWSIEEARWFHLSEAFFHADDADFHAHSAVWDLNCIFCHNVGPRPGYEPSAAPPAAPTLGPRGRVASSVAELGIACEACHGAGGEHARRMRSPVRRAAFQWTEVGDPTIVHPERLGARRSTQVCGRCHGQRVPARAEEIRAILADGDPYRPGEDLARYYAPITAETRLGESSFAPRFWPDGSPRLTAYEYQGLLRSACFEGGDLSCLSCHAMHAGDPHGQLRPDRPGDALCTQCHAGYEGDGLVAHTRHEATSGGSRCIACHMPPEVYGILTWHPSHEIRSPDPRARAALGMPDACTSCHTGRSLAWAAERAEAWWPRLAAVREIDEISEAPEMIRALFGGDVVYRTLAAGRLAEDGPEPGVARAAQPYLARLMLDPFPAVRRAARDALARSSGRADLPRALDARALRLAAARAWTDDPALPAAAPGAFWPVDAEGRVDLARLERWVAARVEVEVPIGE